MLVEHKFGFLPEPVAIKEPHFAIRPLADFRQHVDGVCSATTRDGFWLYPPCREGRSQQRISLPCTHVLEGSDISSDVARYLIAVFGLLNGLRLVPEQGIHFYRVCVERHGLVDFVATDRAIRRVLNLAFDLWVNGSDPIRRNLVGALHWHLFSRSYEHSFEVFAAEYTVLDACWKIHTLMNTEPSTPHALRIARLSKAHDIPLPSWAAIDSGNTSYLSRLRNDLIHEALYARHPIGFAVPKGFSRIWLELHWFNSRLLLALLGENGSYIHTQFMHARALLE